MKFNQNNLICFLLVMIIALPGCEMKNPGLNGTSVKNVSKSPTVTGRDSWQKPELVIEKLGDISDKTIVDIGAGTGYFTFRLAFAAKKVIAAEIDPQMIELIELFRQNLPTNIRDKIETRMVRADDPQIKSNEADIAVIINTIGYIDQPEKYLKVVRSELTPGGKIMIVDFKKKYLPIEAPEMDVRIYGDTLVSYLERAGFDTIDYDTKSLEYQYIIIAQ